MVQSNTSQSRSQVSSRDRWSALLSEQARSGLSISRFCRSHHLTESQYYYWRKRLCSDQSGSHSEPAGGFVELPESHRRESGVWLGLGRWRIGLDPGFDPSTLTRLLEALDPS